MLSVPPAALPASDEARRVRRMRLPDRPAVIELYERHARRDGPLRAARRPEWWEKRLWGYEGDWVVYEGRRRGQIEGLPAVPGRRRRRPVEAGADGERVRGRDARGAPRVVGLPARAARPGGRGGRVRAGRLALAHAARRRGEPARRAEARRAPQHRAPGLRRHAAAGGREGRARDAAGRAARARRDRARGRRPAVLPQNARAWRLTAREGRLHRAPRAARAATAARCRGSPRRSRRWRRIVAGACSPRCAPPRPAWSRTRAARPRSIEPWFRTRPAFLHPMNAF